MPCCLLSNIARERNLPEFYDEIPEEDDMELPADCVDDPNEIGAQEKVRLRRLGFLKRDTIAMNDFGRWDVNTAIIFINIRLLE